MVSHAELSGCASLDDTTARGDPVADLNERPDSLPALLHRAQAGKWRIVSLEIGRCAPLRACGVVPQSVSPRGVSAVMRTASAPQPNHASARSCCTPSRHARPRISVARLLTAHRLTALRVHAHRSQDVRIEYAAKFLRRELATELQTKRARRPRALVRSSCPSCSRRCWRAKVLPIAVMIAVRGLGPLRGSH